MSSTDHALQRTSIRPARFCAKLPGAASLLAVTLCTALALPTVTSAAGKLYRWSEPDGALTFSPTPPSDGTPFEEVDPRTMQKREAASDQAAGDSVASTASAPATTSDSAGTASAATPIMGAAMIERARPVAEPAVGESPEIVARQAAAQASAAASANTKNQRCSELRKRVTSLEQRLASPLTPEDMDNTVVHMARYQQSFERHCG